MDHAPYSPDDSNLYLMDGSWDRHVRLEVPEETFDGKGGPPHETRCGTLAKLLQLKDRHVLVVFYCSQGTIRSPCAAAWYANKYALPKQDGSKNLLDKQAVAVLLGGYGFISSVSNRRVSGRGWQRRTLTYPISRAWPRWKGGLYCIRATANIPARVPGADDLRAGV